MTPTTPAPAQARRLRHPIAAVLLGCLLAVSLAVLNALPAATAPTSDRWRVRPTIVLVHGAWADSSSWSGVISRLQADGYRVLAPPNPLRSLSGDAAYLKGYLDTVKGPVVLVGHSYGASVITNAAAGDRDVKALVFVNGSVPAAGESVAELAGPDSALSVDDPTTIFDFVPATLPPTPGSDVYLHQNLVVRSFATGLSSRQATALWATQRPITLAALNEPSGTPAWASIPSWNLIGTKDRVIPADAQQAMADKAGSTVARYDAGHLGLITDPGPVTRIITAAVRATSG